MAHHTQRIDHLTRHVPGQLFIFAHALHIDVGHGDFARLGDRLNFLRAGAINRAVHEFRLDKLVIFQHIHRRRLINKMIINTRCFQYASVLPRLPRGVGHDVSKLVIFSSKRRFTVSLPAPEIPTNSTILVRCTTSLAAWFGW